MASTELWEREKAKIGFAADMMTVAKKVASQAEKIQ